MPIGARRSEAWVVIPESPFVVESGWSCFVRHNNNIYLLYDSLNNNNRLPLMIYWVQLSAATSSVGSRKIVTGCVDSGGFMVVMQ